MTEGEREKIVFELCQVRDRLEKNDQLFDLTADEVEIEALIYEKKALMLRYSRLLRRAKALGGTGFCENEKVNKKRK